MPLIACVPNVSEGRDEELLEQISHEVDSVRGVRLLDVTSDPVQNRSVFTFVGTQTPLRKAVYNLMRVAFDRLDITKHRGRHPRIGIVDVIPFIPLRQTTMERCVELSRSVGSMLAEAFGVPVYLYEQSATSPNRVSINDIRAGELKNFPDKITKPEWQPDFGPARVHPTAGVVTVGARPPIITFVISVDGLTCDAAGGIVAAIRKVGARPRQVKAMALESDEGKGCKIAVNLFDYKETPLHVVIEAARKAARKNKASITGIRLIGLVTADVLMRSLGHYMQIEGFDPSQVLEFHLPFRRQV